MSAVETKGNERQSNLELLRIITMFLIVAHHYVVNSGVTAVFSLESLNSRTIFLQLWGMWGKTGINIFVLISGYFMCQSRLTWKRYAKIYLEAKFYRVIIFIIFLVAGYEVLNLSSIFSLLFGFIKGMDNGFTSSFLMFYLFIPFYNLLIKNMDKSMFRRMILLLLFMYTVAGTFFFNRTVFSEIGWYMTLYFVGAYLCIHPNKWSCNQKYAGIAAIALILLSFASVIIIDVIGVKIGVTDTYYMVSDSHKFLAFSVAVAVFLFFKNINLGTNRIINTIASTTFGVFCIHASSNAMRTFLWKDLLDVQGAYELSIGLLVLHAVGSAVGIFVVCSVIDILRIKIVEKPVFSLLSKYIKK